jgi:hypothetical protein
VNFHFVWEWVTKNGLNQVCPIEESIGWYIYLYHYDQLELWAQSQPS